MRIQQLLQSAAITMMGAAMLMGCNDAEDKGCKGEGFTRCLGAYPPDEIVADTSEPGVSVQKLIWNAGKEGPRCIKEVDEIYTAYIREGSASSKDLTIYLPPVGAWLVQSINMMLDGGNVIKSYASRPTTMFTGDTPFDFINDSTFLYVSACDGSMYLSDKDYTTPMLEEVLSDIALPNKDTNPRYYRGFINASSSINELGRQNPDPERVFLLGSLAGGYGVIGMAAHTAETFPNADIFILQDGSPAMGMGDVDPQFFTTMVNLWGADKVLPKDSGEYGTTGHVMTLMNWALERYDNLHAATFASTQEASIRTIVNLAHLDSDPITKPIYSCFVTSTLEYVRQNAAEKAGGRYNYYVVDRSADNIGELRGGDRTGDREQYALELPDGSTGPTVKEWIDQFVNKSPEWTSYAELEMTPDMMGHCKDAR